MPVNSIHLSHFDCAVKSLVICLGKCDTSKKEPFRHSPVLPSSQRQQEELERKDSPSDPPRPPVLTAPAGGAGEEGRGAPPPGGGPEERPAERPPEQLASAALLCAVRTLLLPGHQRRHPARVPAHHAAPLPPVGT